MCLIATEATIFMIFVIAYVFYIGKSLTGPYPPMCLTLPIWATVCLLSSSLTVEMAVRGVRDNSRSRFLLWMGITILLGLEFLRQTAIEWNKLINQDHLTIATNLFGTTYYSLVGLHASHVVIGLTLLVAGILAICERCRIARAMSTASNCSVGIGILWTRFGWWSSQWFTG